jgi:exoribonuclease II
MSLKSNVTGIIASNPDHPEYAAGQVTKVVLNSVADWLEQSTEYQQRNMRMLNAIVADIRQVAKENA